MSSSSYKILIWYISGCKSLRSYKVRSSSQNGMAGGVNTVLIWRYFPFDLEWGGTSIQWIGSFLDSWLLLDKQLYPRRPLSCFIWARPFHGLGGGGRNTSNSHSSSWLDYFNVFYMRLCNFPNILLIPTLLAFWRALQIWLVT